MGELLFLLNMFLENTWKNSVICQRFYVKKIHKMEALKEAL